MKRVTPLHATGRHDNAAATLKALLEACGYKVVDCGTIPKHRKPRRIKSRKLIQAQKGEA